MSPGRVLKTFSAVLLGALLWKWAAGMRNGLTVLRYAPAGLASGVALVWIFRTFASMQHTRRSFIWSAIVGLFAFTPLVAILLVDSTDTSNTSRLVLAFSAGAGAAMGGAIYGVITLAHDAFTDWRHERS